MLTESEGPDALALTSDSLLTNPTDGSKVIAELKISKAPSPIVVTNRALRNLPRKAVTFLTKVRNGVLKRHGYPAVCKLVLMISLLKQDKDPVLPSPYRPISPLDTVGSSSKRSCYPGSWQRSTREAFSGTISSDFDPGTALPCSLVERVRKFF